MKTKAQEKQILEWLESGNAITPLEALDRFGCFRLGARIFSLKKSGHNIIANMVEANGKRFAEYRLV